MVDSSSTAGGQRHLTRLEDLDDAALNQVLRLASELKRGGNRADLAGKSVGMLFFRGSLRTRISFEAAVHQLGGHPHNLTAHSDFWELEEKEGRVMDGRAPEHVKDAARVLSEYLDVLAVRPALSGRNWAIDRKDAQIDAFRRYAQVPVINLESALYHPLQGLGDLVTWRETFGEDLRGKRLCLTWVHSPEPASVAVTHSALLAAARVGMDISVAHPKGYDLDEQVVESAKSAASAAGGQVRTGVSLEDGVQGAQVVYARSWRSLDEYDNPTLTASRRAKLAKWRLDEETLAQGDDARLMHAMPIRRNVEVSDEVLDGPRSLVIEQAANRLHASKALLLNLFGQG
jgi:N-acetylornithine carbamoyltransferase